MTDNKEYKQKMLIDQYLKPKQATPVKQMVTTKTGAAFMDTMARESSNVKRKAQEMEHEDEEDDDDDEEEDEDFDPDAEEDDDDDDDDDDDEEDEEIDEANNEDDEVSDEGGEMHVDPDDLSLVEDEGEAYMENLFVEKDLDDSDLDENEVHNLETGKEKKKYSYNEEELTHTEWDMTQLFYDRLSYYALAERTRIVNRKIKKALDPKQRKEIEEALAASRAFKKKLDKLGLSLMKEIARSAGADENNLAFVANRLQKAQRVHIAPLASVIALCPVLSEPAHKHINRDFVTQHEIAETKALLFNTSLGDVTTNFVLSAKTASLAIAIFFIVNLIPIVDCECAKFAREAITKDPDVMPEQMIMKYIHLDAKRTVRMFSNFFLRQLKHVLITLPNVHVPQTIYDDLMD